MLPFARARIFLALIAIFALAGTASATTFQAGSLVIPMDTRYQDYGMFKAYGLVYRLAQSGIPVSWAIQPTKTFDGVDFTATSVDARLGTAINGGAPYNYAGGPFIIDSADAATAQAIINTWWTANANQPAVHRATASFDATIDISISRAPVIALESINCGIAIAYFNAAGIPDMDGNVWSSDSPNVTDETEIGNGFLFGPGTCYRNRFDLFVTPHNDGYAYSLTDPTNPGTKAYAALDNFVKEGGGWLALCHSILSNENSIYDLLANGSPAVRSLFVYQGAASGFLTQNGFTTIANLGGTWTVNRPDLPIAQAVSTPSATQTLPGGSVQTWDSASVTYLDAVERVASFVNPPKVYDATLNGVYHGGLGRGKLTFIGGHSFATTLPYSKNMEGPYLRFFYNALFFNGVAVAKLEMQTRPTNVLQGALTDVAVDVVNVGASTARNISAPGTPLTVTLSSGIDYLSTTGPQPATNVLNGDGTRTLTWGTVGDVAAGATALTLNTRVAFASTGEYQIGAFQATYGDNFGETFFAHGCLEIEVLPAPIPVVVKTPPSQGPYIPGDVALWTLNYTNSGMRRLEEGVVEDVLPAGFSLDLPTTIPEPTSVVSLPDGTTRVRWSVGDVDSGFTALISIGAVIPDVESDQTFTNVATLSGYDDSGNSYVSPLSEAEVMVTGVIPEFDLNKTVDVPLASPGDTLTYTMAPTYNGITALSNVIVTDPVPANTTYVAGSANAGGTFDGTSIRWSLGSNTPASAGIVAPVGFAYCPVNVKLTPVADTFIDKGNAALNYGANVSLKTRPSNSSSLKYGLLKFDLSSIPSGAVVVGATLGLTVTNDAANHIDEVRLVITNWTETGATWNQRNATTAWSAGAFSASDYSTAYGTIIPNSLGLRTVPVLDAVKTWLAGTPNYGLALVATGTDGSDLAYASRENATVAIRPYLTISYLVPQGTPCNAPPTLRPAADTYIQKGSPNAPSGGSTTLVTNPGSNDSTTLTRHALLQFDLSSVPFGATITSAVLTVSVTTARANHVDEIHRMTTAWTEAGATWNRRDGTSPWGSGASFSTVDYSSTVSATFTPAATGNRTADLTSLVNDWVNNGVANYGVVLLSTGADTGNAAYSSREESIVGRRPKLVVTWTLPAVADTYIQKSAVGTNAGDDTDLVTDPGNLDTTNNTVHSLVRFDLSTIPPGATVNSATLTLHTTLAKAHTDEIHRMTTPWTEMGATWSKRNGSTAWAGGGAFSAADYNATSYGAISAATTGTKTVDVTSLVNDWINNNVPNYGFVMLSTGTDNSDAVYGSRENADPALRPSLQVNWTVPVSTTPGTKVDLRALPLLLTGNGTITVSLTVSATEADVVGVVPPAALTVTPVASVATLVSGPAPAGPITITNGSSQVFTYEYAIDPGTAPGIVAFSGKPTASGGATFQGATTQGVIITPPLTFQATVNAVPPTVAQITNHATMRDELVFTAGQVSATAQTRVEQVLLSVSKVVSPTGTVQPGTTLTYTITARNDGNGAATNVVIHDPVPAYTTYAACAVPAGWSCSLVGSEIQFTAPTFAPFSSAVVTFTVTTNTGLSVGTYPVSNSCTIQSMESPTPAGSNTAVVTLLVRPELTIMKTASCSPPANADGQVTPGTTITYTIVVTNIGKGPTDVTVVSDAIQNGTTYVPASGSWTKMSPAGSGTPAQTVNGSGRVTLLTFHVGTLNADCAPPGCTTTAQFQVTVDSPAVSGNSITNVAQVTATGMDNPQSSGAVSYSILAAPALTVSKSSNPPSGEEVMPGDIITYTLVAQNTGNANTLDAAISDAIPAGTTYVANSTALNGTHVPDQSLGVAPIASSFTVFSPCCPEPSGDSGTLVVGAPNVSTVTFQVRVDANMPNGSAIGNQASGEIADSGPVLSNTTIHPVYSSPLLAVEKTVDPSTTVFPGTALTYTITVTNYGSLTATNVTVTDPIPDGVEYLDLSASDAGVNVDGVITWTGLTIEPGASVVLSFQAATTIQTADYSIANTASASYFHFADSTDATGSMTAQPSNEVVTDVLMPTLATMRSVDAVQDGDAVLITWSTTRESGNLGFNVYRDEGGVRTKINAQLIAGSAFASSLRHGGAGFTYRYHDTMPATTALVSYWVEDVDLRGNRTLQGPVVPRVDRSAASTARAFSLGPATDSAPLPGLGTGGAVLLSETGSGVVWPSAMPTATSAQWTLQREVAASPALKLFAAREGWYRVTKAEMTAAGFDPGTDPRRLSLYTLGVQLPILVKDGGDGRFDATDFVEFFGTPLDLDSTGARTYWLRVAADTTAPPRIAMSNATSSNAFNGSVPFTITRKERFLFAPDVRADDGVNFFGAVITSTPATEELVVRNLDVSSTSDAVLTIGLQGGSQVPHSTRVEINGHYAGTIDIDRIALKTSTFDVPSSWLAEGSNSVTLTARGGEDDVSVVTAVSLTYRHRLRADEGLFEAALPAGRRITIAGFTDASVRAFDVTNAAKPVLLKTTVTSASGEYTATFATPGTSGTRIVLVFTPSRLLRSPESIANQPSTLSATPAQKKANFVIVTGSAFLTAAQALKNTRAAAGVVTLIANVDDVYDEYSFGVRSPDAIRRFLQQTTTWAVRPRYALLLGDASADPRNYLETGVYDFVPTHTVKTRLLNTVSDDWFVDFDNDATPDLAIGRIPVRTATEANAVIAKITSRGTPSGTWASRALFVADTPNTYDFDREAGELAAMLPTAMTSSTVQSGVTPSPHDAIVSGFNEGQLFVDYVGHGSVELWSDYTFTSTDAGALTNAGRLPIVIDMTCLNGFFHDLYTESLAEALMRNAGGGAVAVWASSGLTEPDHQELMNREFFRLVFGSQLSVGEAAARAKRVVTDEDTRRTWIFFGDPSMKLR